MNIDCHEMDESPQQKKNIPLTNEPTTFTGIQHRIFLLCSRILSREFQNCTLKSLIKFSKPPQNRGENFGIGSTPSKSACFRKHVLFISKIICQNCFLICFVSSKCLKLKEILPNYYYYIKKNVCSVEERHLYQVVF